MAAPLFAHPTSRLIAVANQKGGCGKTALTVNLANELALKGNRVLVVDLDSQGNATTGLGLTPDESDLTLAEALLSPETAPMHEIVLETDTPRLHLAPAHMELASLPLKMSKELGREGRLKKALAPIQHLYDYILIDTPPSLGLLTVNAFAAAREILVPAQLHPFALDGLGALLETVEVVREELNPEIRISGIVVMMYNGRTKIQREILERIRARPELSRVMFSTFVRASTAIPESNELRMPLADYAPDSAVRSDLVALAEEILRQNQCVRSQDGATVDSIRNRILELNRLSREKVAHSPCSGPPPDP